MATSRTGTANWKRVRDERRRLQLRAGQTHCPRCRTQLDWEYSKRPNSAEVDHITPAIQGGKDTLQNTRVICRLCNAQLGQLAKPKRKQTTTTTTTLTTSNTW